MNTLSNIGHGVSAVYHSLETAQPGLGRGVAQFCGGSSMVAAGASWIISRTAACYAANLGLMCGEPVTASVALASTMLVAGGLFVSVGLNNIVKGNVGDRTASAVNAANSLGRLAGKGDLGNRLKKIADNGEKALEDFSEIRAAASSGWQAANEYWYGTPAQATAAEKTD